MQRILIPTDFSDMALNAVNYGVELARRCNASITVMHSVQKPSSPPQGPVRDRSEITEEDQNNITLWQELEQLSEWIRGGRPEIEKVTQRMPSGLPGDEILKAVREEGSDLVVMGTKGEKGFSDTLMGTTTSNVIQKAPCNVLTVPEKASFQGIEAVAYASGLHEKDPLAIRSLLEFLDDFKARIDVVHVHGKGEHPADQDLKAFQEGLERFGLSDAVGFDTIEGAHLEEALDAYVDNKELDLLAMLNESRNFIQRLFHKSKTKKMAFHSKLPLLVLHTED